MAISTWGNSCITPKFSRVFLATDVSPSFMSEGIAPKMVLRVVVATWVQV